MMWKFSYFTFIIILLGATFSSAQTHELEIREKLRKAVSLEAQGNLKEASRFLNEAASLHWDEQEYDSAITHYEHSLMLNKRLKNGNGVAGLCSNLGMIYSDIGQYERAAVYMNQNLEIRRIEGKKSRILTSLLNLSVVLNNLKRYEASIDHLKEATRLAQEMNDSEKMRTCYGMLAETYEKMENLELTRHYFELYRSFHEMIQRRKEAHNEEKLADAKAQTQLLEIQKKNQKLELELKAQELRLRQEQISQQEQELQEIEGLLVQADSSNRDLMLKADKKELIIMALEEQKRSRKLALEKAQMRENVLIAALAVVILIGFILFRNYRQKTQLNAELRRQNETIIEGKEQLQSSNTQLAAAVQEAEAASFAKSQFLSTISHEIRTPMNSVIGFTNLLRMKNPQPHQEEYLKTLEFSANHLLALINDVLDFSKIEAGKLELLQTNLNLTELLRHLKRIFQPKAAESGIDLLLQSNRSSDIFIQGDEVRLNQILTNLVGNALKFTEKGQVSIGFEAINESEEEILCRISITDTGIGISPEKRQAIFEQFTQANSDTTRKFGGTGLGLAISKHLVELMQGRIWVESQEGIGSTFSIEIPFLRGNPNLAEGRNAAGFPTRAYGTFSWHEGTGRR